MHDVFGITGLIRTFRENSSISVVPVVRDRLGSLSLLFDVHLIAQLITESAEEPIDLLEALIRFP